jgi:hypothetical protein
MSMNEVKLKLETRHNSSIEFSMAIVDLKTGLPVDLTTADIWFTAKRNADDLDAAAIVQVTKAAGDIVVGTGPDTNKFTVRADHVAGALDNDTMDLRCDVKIKLPDQYAQVVGDGKLKVLEAVTQAG